jgi:hypothetical protein
VIYGGKIQKVTIGEARNLSCSSYNGKPGAAISWHKDSTRISHNIFSRTTLTNSTDKREDTVSHVTIVSTKDDHGKRIECWAVNEVQKTPLKAYATLDVQCMYKVKVSEYSPYKIYCVIS